MSSGREEEGESNRRDNRKLKEMGWRGETDDKRDKTESVWAEEKGKVGRKRDTSRGAGMWEVERET